MLAFLLRKGLFLSQAMTLCRDHLQWRKHRAATGSNSGRIRYVEKQGRYTEVPEYDGVRIGSQTNDTVKVLYHAEIATYQWYAGTGTKMNVPTGIPKSNWLILGICMVIEWYHETYLNQDQFMQ